MPVGWAHPVLKAYREWLASRPEIEGTVDTIAAFAAGAAWAEQEAARRARESQEDEDGDREVQA